MLDGQGRHRRVTVAVTIGAALTLGACGSPGGTEEDGPGPDALAASVGETRYSVGEVQRASRQLTEYAAAQASATGQPPQEISPQSLVTSLVQVPIILEYAKEHDIAIPSAEAVKDNLDQALESPSEETVQFFRASAVYSQMDSQAQQQLSETIQQSDVTYSPRYAKAAGQNPNWLKQVEPTVRMP